VGFGERAVAAAVAAQTVVWPGMFHVFQRCAAILPDARRADAQIAAFIRLRLDNRSQGPVLVSIVGDELVQGGEGSVQQI
jgi:acetyl esterase/lipase